MIALTRRFDYIITVCYAVVNPIFIILITKNG